MPNPLKPGDRVFVEAIVSDTTETLISADAGIWRFWVSKDAVYTPASLPGFREGIEAAARIARDGCLVPPDGGSPTQGEIDMCENIAAAIRTLTPPATPREARLEEALREAALQIEYLHEKFQETGSGNAVLAKIGEALK